MTASRYRWNEATITQGINVVYRRIYQLIATNTSGDSLDPNTAEWLTTLEDSIRNRIAKLGLCEAPRQRRTLDAWNTEFRDLNPQWKPSSIENREAATGPLLEFFEGHRIIDTIRPHEADDFRKRLLTEGHNRQTGKDAHAGQQTAAILRHCRRHVRLHRSCSVPGLANDHRVVPIRSVAMSDRNG